MPRSIVTLISAPLPSCAVSGYFHTWYANQAATATAMPSVARTTRSAVRKALRDILNRSRNLLRDRRPRATVAAPHTLRIG